MKHEALTADVAIVGFGPVGAVLAGLLGRRGISVIVLERECDVYPLPRAAHIDHQGLRTLQELGCFDTLLPTMRLNPGMDFVNADRKVLLRVPSDRPSRSGLPASMYFHQPGFDRTIRETVTALPSVRVLLETDVTQIEPHGTGALLRAMCRDGRTLAVTARYVVACDGTRSPMRTELGIALDDTGFQEQWLVVDVKLLGPVPTLPNHAVHICDPARPHTVVPMPEPRFRFELMLLPGEDPTRMQTPDAVADLLSPWIPKGLAALERGAIYTFNGRVAQRWRAGPVFLAGDAAHQMPPFLGQGMCSGLRDAANLAWKLAAILQGRAPDALLDTYETERKPHVTTIIDTAVRFGRIICTLDHDEAAARDERLLGDAESGARERSAFALPLLHPGPLVQAGGGALFVQPEIGGRRLDDIVGARFFVLARDAARLGEAAAWWKERAYVSTLDDLDDPAGSLRRWLDNNAADVVVVRPDRYVLGCGPSLSRLTEAVRPLLQERVLGERDSRPLAVLDTDGQTGRRMA